MKIEESQVRRLTISEVPSLDPIRVMLEDIGPGQGRINIECWGKSWANFFGGMGERTIAQFFVSCDEHYLAGKLGDSIEADIFDPDGLYERAVREIIKERRKWFMGREEARRKYDDAEQLRNIETEADAWSKASTLVEYFGDDWHCALPTKPNPDYTYLCRIIKTVQDALKVIA